MGSGAEGKGASEPGWQSVGTKSESSSSINSCKRYAGGTTERLCETGSACGGSRGAFGIRGGACVG